MIENALAAAASETDSCAGSVWDADGDHAAGQAWIWSHRSALANAAERPSLAWSRIVALALALAVHLAMLLRLTLPPPAVPSAPTKDPRRPATATNTATDGLRLVFVTPTKSVEPHDLAAGAVIMPPSAASAPELLRSAPAAPTPPVATPTLAPIRDPRAAAAREIVKPRDAAPLPVIANDPAPPARLFRPDGSVALPAAVIADLRAVESKDRTFDYMNPGLADAGSAFRPEPTLPYTPTRFDADWKPVRTLGEDVIVPIAELLSFENKRKSFRCSLIPPVCSWGRVDPGLDLDDPTTLDPTEDAQCRSLWDSIVAATDEAESLTLRSRFDSECRKPLARDGLPPAPRAVHPTPG